MYTPKYTPDSATLKDLDNRFIHHPPLDDQHGRYEEIRANFRNLAGRLLSNCPPSRELSLALTNLEQAQFWANASIARHE